jgi:hypothetical protein
MLLNFSENSLSGETISADNTTASPMSTQGLLKKVFSQGITTNWQLTMIGMDRINNAVTGVGIPLKSYC